MINFFKKFFFIESSIKKNIAVLVSGTLISQIIPILFYPLFTRLFTPADFGLFALFLAIITWIDVISTGRYELAIILPEKDEDSIYTFGGGFIFLILICLLMCIIIFLFSENIGRILNTTAIKKCLWLTPPAVFVMGLAKLFNNWLIRKKSFKEFALNKIYQRGIEGVSTFGFSMVQSVNGLIAGDFIGRFSLMVIAARQVCKKDFRLTHIDRLRFIQILKRYKQFPLYNTIPAMFNTGCSLIPVFLISSFYSDVVTGYFNLSRQMLAIPVALISANLSQVLFRHVAEKKNNNLPIYEEVKSVAIKLGIVSIMMISLIFFLGPWLFKIIFGEQWTTAGEYCQIVVFSYAFSFIVTSLSIVLVVLDKVKMLSIWQTVYFIAMCILFLCKDLLIKEFLIVATIIDVLAFSIYLSLILNVLKKHDLNLSKTTS